MRTTDTYMMALLRSLASESVVVLILAGTASKGVIYTGVDATFSCFRRPHRRMVALNVV
jgi:hypothetical protein